MISEIMPVEVTAESPLAKALQEAMHPKLMEMGWSSGSDDGTLSEYIILMLANGKSQDQIASELSNDLLDLGPEDQGATAFAGWLFQQVDSINARLNGTSNTNGSAPAAAQDESMQHDNMIEATDHDAEMGDASTGGSATMYDKPYRSANKPDNFLTKSSPTGPKAMRNGHAKNGRGGRMANQINKTMGHSTDSALHRVRSGPGSGRINSHSREPPKGPRSQNLQRGLQMAAQRPMPGMQMSNTPMGGPMGQAPQLGGVMSTQDQMQFMATLAETAQAMAFQMQQLGSMNPGMFPQGAQNGGFVPGAKFHRGGGHFHDKRHHNGNRMQSNNSHDSQAGDSSHVATGGERKDTDMEGEGSKGVSKVQCKFDIMCTKTECPFAHHSPGAKPGDPLPEIDMETDCSFGVRCANSKCNGRHPSRAKRANFQAEQDCLYGPWCSNPSCAFKHPPPGTKECRHGGDCKTPDCTFWHTKMECKHTPCKNALCKYKHKDGQREYAVRGNVWTANGEKKEHVSERKFVQDEGAEEEVIIPGSTVEISAESADSAMIT